MGELMRRSAAELPALPETLEGMRETLAAMAELLRQNAERMAALETEVRRLTKVTPSQARALQAAIRDRSAEVCRMHRAEGHEKEAAAAIRKAVRLTCGVTAFRDLPRCDWNVAMKQVQLWDDYKVMKGLRR